MRRGGAARAVSTARALGTALLVGTVVFSVIALVTGPAAARDRSSSRDHGGGGTPVATPVRAVPDPLHGVTVDDVSDLSAEVAAAGQLPDMPTTRIYFDVREPASYYAPAVAALRPVSYLMGELLDSSDARHIGVGAYAKRVDSYLATLGSDVDIWEIGNEVNGNWTGRYPNDEAKLTRAYDEVSAAGGRTALTLYENVGCGDGPGELDPLTFSTRYVPAEVRDGLDYVFLSYYEDECNGIRPSAASWTTTFEQLHSLYPDAQLGFGEIGMAQPVTAATLGTARSLMAYYYGLQIPLPYYVGGYFWWYYAEDCLPAPSAPLWSALTSAFGSESAALSP